MGLQTDDFEQPPRISRASARFGKSGKGREARLVGYGAAVKYWQIILKNLRNAGWNCDCISSTDHKGREFLVVAAEREDAGRFIGEADQELPAFLELESAITTHRHNHDAAESRHESVSSVCALA